MEAPRSFESRHLPGLLALWTRRWGRTFPLDRALWRQNTEGDPRHFRTERCWIVEGSGTVVGGLALKVPDDPPAWSGQDPRHGWISFLVAEPGRDPEIAPLLLKRALTCDHEFPGRWAYETRQRLAIEPSPADVLVLSRGADIIGFCHVYHRGSRRIGPPIYWRGAIGRRFGGLGPIGVARAFRGRGLGAALLALALEHLRRAGVERAVIDWTALVDFYGRFGFRIWRTYRSWHLEL